MKPSFDHRALELKNDMPLVYTAMSKHTFYFRMFISKFVLEQGAVPLNPFMILDYWLLDTVDRNTISNANNVIVMKSDETWVFGPVSNGVLAEILIAKEAGKPVRYFALQKPHTIAECSPAEVELEDEVAEYRDKL